jgi:hypothetical protein
MTEKPKYQFRGERVEAALVDAAGGVLEEGDLEDVWQDLVTDGSDSAMLLTELKVTDFANRVVSGDFGPRPPMQRMACRSAPTTHQPRQLR